jgi:hypothetical protein
VSFVATGVDDNFEWDISSHVGVTNAQKLEGGGSYGDGMEQMQYRYLDPGVDSIEVVFRTDEGRVVVDVENVQLPPHP